MISKSSYEKLINLAFWPSLNINQLILKADLLWSIILQLHRSTHIPSPTPLQLHLLDCNSFQIKFNLPELLTTAIDEAKQYLEWHNQHFQPAATLKYVGQSEVESIYWVPGFLHECHDVLHTDLTKKKIFRLFYQGQEHYFLIVLGTLGFPSITTEHLPPSHFKS